MSEINLGFTRKASDRVAVTEDGRNLFEIKVDPDTKKVSLTFDERADLELVNAELAPGKATTDHVADEESGRVKIDRNWKIENGKFVCWHPTTGAEASLPVYDVPGGYTPKDVPEVIGQPEALFKVVLGFMQGDKHVLLSGPTGTAKTTMFRWIAAKCNWNLIELSISRSTEAAHLVGEYQPTGAGEFEWTDAPVTTAMRLSHDRKTILMFDEVNRIGNLAEFARIYPVLDARNQMDIPEKRDDSGQAERVYAKAGDLLIAATMNPADDDKVMYIGVQEMDPALMDRFAYIHEMKYPESEVEAATLRKRSPSVTLRQARLMVNAANRIRESHNVAHPVSFRQLMNWADAVPYMGMVEAAETALIQKADRSFHESMRTLMRLKTDGEDTVVDGEIPSVV